MGLRKKSSNKVGTMEIDFRNILIAGLIYGIVNSSIPTEETVAVETETPEYAIDPEEIQEQIAPLINSPEPDTDTPEENPVVPVNETVRSLPEYIDWPTGVTVEFYTQGQACIPCMEWEEEELPKIDPDNIFTVNVLDVPEAVTEKSIPSTPYFILYRDGREVKRVRGKMSAENMVRNLFSVQTSATTISPSKDLYAYTGQNWYPRNGSGRLNTGWSRQSKINHLMSGEHGYSYEELQQYSDYELQLLHNKEHRTVRNTVRPIRVYRTYRYNSSYCSTCR
jgi:hypothetical protein